MLNCRGFHSFSLILYYVYFYLPVSRERRPDNPLPSMLSLLLPPPCPRSVRTGKMSGQDHKRRGIDIKISTRFLVFRWKRRFLDSLISIFSLYSMEIVRLKYARSLRPFSFYSKTLTENWVVLIYDSLVFFFFFSFLDEISITLKIHFLSYFFFCLVPSHLLHLGSRDFYLS